MPGPAARLTDQTAHGGVVTGPGCPTVLIGKMPAARLTDMQACPLVTPAPVPPPHATGPISAPGVPTVLIGKMPAATMGDVTTCVGPPGAVAMGCMTVLIGTSGGGGGGGGGGGITQVATAGAISAVVAAPGPAADGPHWFECQFVDTAGIPITEVRYELTDPSNNATTGILTGNGTVKRGGLPDPGQYRIQLYVVYNARWSTEAAKVGDQVELTADIEGYENGTPGLFRVWERDCGGADELVEEIDAEVNNGRLETKWEYRYRNDRDTSNDKEDKNGYSYPEYYFIVHVRDDKARSGQLRYQDFVEIELKDQDDNPIPKESYILHLSNGEVRRGELDQNGYKKEEKIPPGKWSVEFPEIKDS
jgi:uncharacterized Zn-binding protein involved in type VI secretion